jgi:putative flippase GtrA
VSQQVWRYALVGMMVFAIDYAVFAALTWSFPGAHLPANIGGKVAGAASGFFLHRNFTFAGPQRDGAARQAISYAALLLFNLALSTALLWLLVDQLALNAYASRLFTDGVVIITAFLGSRLWVYRKA